jgi:hypothetical protein
MKATAALAVGEPLEGHELRDGQLQNNREHRVGEGERGDDRREQRAAPAGGDQAPRTSVRAHDSNGVTMAAPS